MIKLQSEIALELILEVLEMMREFDFTALTEQQAIINQLLAQILVKLDDERT